MLYGWNSPVEDRTASCEKYAAGKSLAATAAASLAAISFPGALSSSLKAIDNRFIGKGVHRRLASNRIRRAIGTG
jgi:hypothetical protein